MNSEEQQEDQFISCSNPDSEQPSSEDSKPVSSPHPPVLMIDIQPRVSNCGAEQGFLLQISQDFPLIL
jgi:hypothetical protein